MWLIFTIFTVIFWGTSETIFKKSSKDDPHSTAHLLGINGIIFGISGFIYMLIIYRGFNFDFINVLKYLPIAATYLLSMFAYYNAMKRVKISLISPIVNSSCVITVLLCIFLLREYPSPLGIFAIILVISSLIALSINKTPEDDVEEDKKINVKLTIFIIGLVFAFGYFILDGVASFMDESFLNGYMRDEDMIISHSLISFIVGVTCYIYLKIKDKSYKIKLDKLKLSGSIFETLR